MLRDRQPYRADHLDPSPPPTSMARRRLTKLIGTPLCQDAAGRVVLGLVVTGPGSG